MGGLGSIHIGDDREGNPVSIQVDHTGVSSEWALGYTIGFLEGEGGFLLVKEKGVRPLTPVVSMYNTDRTPLEFIQKVLAFHHIKSAIYHYDPKPDKRFGGRQARRCYTLRVCYRQNCLPLMRLFEGKIIARGKQEQFRLWKESMLNRENEVVTKRERIRARNEMVLRRVAAGESPLVIGKELGLAEGVLYVMLHRRYHTTVSKLRNDPEARYRGFRELNARRVQAKKLKGGETS